MSGESSSVLIVVIDANEIVNWESFHSVFQKKFGFFDGYGRNMDAWIDCMGSLDDPSPGLSDVRLARGSTLTLKLLNIVPFKSRCPDIYDAMIECTAFVNWRYAEANEAPAIALAFYG